MPKMLIDAARLSGAQAGARAHKALGPGYFRAEAVSADAADVFIFGEIGGFWDGVQAVDFAKDIAALDAPKINVRLNSPGGSVFDGIAIYNALVTHKAEIVVSIEGVAASIASVVAMAGDIIRIGESANIMIHKPWSFAIGDAEDMRKEAEVLDNLEAGIVDIYAARTGQDSKVLSELVSAETWYRGQLAVDAGFADEIIPAKKKEKKAALRMPLLALFGHTPPDLLSAPADGPKVRQFEHLLREMEQQPIAYAKRVAALASQVFMADRDDRQSDPREEDESSTHHAAVEKLAAHIRSLISR